MQPDPITLTGIGMTVLGSRDLLNKLLGPTADYIGSELLNLVKRCNVNVDGVLRVAIRKLGDKIAEPATANPRVLQQVVSAAMFCEDPIVAEYLGGVLASSRTVDGKDDRGVCFLNDIQSLSNYQLRTHYLVYSSIIRHGCEIQTNVRNWYGSKSHETITLIFSDDSYLTAMKCNTASQKRSIGKHSFLGLEARHLLRGGINAFQMWDALTGPIEKPWRYCWPTPYGHELFAWGLGLGDLELASYFDIPSSLLSDVLPPLEVLNVELGEITIMGEARDYGNDVNE